MPTSLISQRSWIILPAGIFVLPVSVFTIHSFHGTFRAHSLFSDNAINVQKLVSVIVGLVRYILQISSVIWWLLRTNGSLVTQIFKSEFLVSFTSERCVIHFPRVFSTVLHGNEK